MRLSSLNLIRYGLFEDRELDLPPDRMCIVYGPNEAGKTTALSALSDLLYGFPHSTNYAFRFDVKDLRLGGEVIGRSGKQLRFRRRKGRTNTLLNDDDKALPDDALAEFIGRSDRALFERAFGLSHERLREGGAQMLQAGGDIGESLIEAGSGITDLLDIQRALQSAADDLYTERKVQSKPFYQALARHDQARKDLRELTLNVSEWRQAEKDVAESEEKLADLQSRIAVKAEEAARISRSRRVLSILREIDQYRDALQDLKDIPELPDDAGTRRIEALDAIARADELLARLAADEDRLRKEINESPVDQRLLQHSQEIDALYEDRGEVIANERDIPKRQAEADRARADLAALAERLGHDSSEALEAFQPGELELEGFKEAISEGVRIAGAVRDANDAFESAKQDLASVRKQLEELDAPSNPAGLRREVESLRAVSSGEADVQDREAALRASKVQLDEAVSSLGLWLEGADGLAQAPLPVRASLTQFQSEAAELDQEAHRSKQAYDSSLEAIEVARREMERLEAGGEVPTKEVLSKVRRERDEAWALARRILVNMDAPSVEEIRSVAGDRDLEDVVEAFIHQADELADRREAEAQRIAQHVRSVADFAAGERDRAMAEQLITATAANLEDHERRWRELWAPLGIEPRAPVEMIEWLERAREVLRLRKEHNDLAEQLAKENSVLSKSLAGAKDLAARIGVELDPDLSLAQAVNLLSSRIDDHEARWGQYRDLSSLSTERQARLDQANRKREQSLEDQASWKLSWNSLLPRFGLDGELSLTQAERAATTWQELRSTRRTIEGLEHRIKAMRSVSQDFGDRVKELCEAVASDLTGTPPIEGLRILFERLGQQQKQDTRFQELSDRLRKVQEEMATTRDRVRDGNSDLAALAELAGVHDPADLEVVIAKAANRKECMEKLKAAQDRLVKDGDGFSEENLRAESEDYSSEDLQRQELAVTQEREELTAELSAAAAAMEQAKRQQADLRAAGTAETASQELHSSLAELAAHARDWARSRVASILLKEAIDRFRQEYQNPLLTRAGQIFEAITLRAFLRFAVEYDEKDQPRLVGLRPNGATCPVAGMSDGTRDQLYLSLRIAALESYCEQEEALPFVGDDLFVHFDDDRAAAGLKMLAGLSSCQVLLFTHHSHLVDIATKNIHNTCTVVEI